MSPTTEFSDRQHPDTIILFDVDGTLTPARNVSYIKKKTRLFIMR